MSRRNSIFPAVTGSVPGIAVYLHFLLIVRTPLIYHEQQPVFLTTFDFLRDLVARPGGPLRYVALLASQTFPAACAGALVVGAVIVGTCAATRALLRRFARDGVSPVAWWMPAVMLTMLFGRYYYALFDAVALLAAIVAAWGYARLARSRRTWRLFVFVAMIPLVYWLSGGMVVLFALLCALYECLANRGVPAGVFCLALAPAAPIVVMFSSYSMPPLAAWAPLTPMGPVVASLLVWIVGASVLSGFGVRLLSRVKRLTPARSFAGFVLLGAAAIWWFFDANVSRQIALDEAAQRGEWREVLRIAGTIDAGYYGPYVVHEVNRALEETGGLSTSLCEYIQFGGCTGATLAAENPTPPDFLKSARFCFDVGQVNFAQHWAHMALEMRFRETEALKLLVRINLLKDRPETALTYVGALECHLRCRAWARDWRERIRRDPKNGLDATLAELRPRLPRVDHGYGAFGTFGYESILTQALEADPSNREALDYLMTFYLLNRRYDDVIENLYRLAPAGYRAIPPCWQEAILLYRLGNPGVRADLQGFSISEDLLKHSEEFLVAVMKYRAARGRSDEMRFRSELIRDWGDTYLFYGVIGFSEPRPGWARGIRAPRGEEER